LYHNRDRNAVTNIHTNIAHYVLSGWWLFHPGMMRDPSGLEKTFQSVDDLLWTNWRQKRFTPLVKGQQPQPVPPQPPQLPQLPPAILDPMDDDVEEELEEYGTVPTAAAAMVLSNGEEIVLEEGVADLGDPMVS
jgi:hypothetical protein